MSEASGRGPEVDAGEELYRAITVADWWDATAEPPRVRSFAFKVRSPFSVNIASKIDRDGALRHLRETLHSPHGGLVEFNCGTARSLRFDAREELDPADPANIAHANVHYVGANSQRKADAKRLAEACRTVHEPTF